MSTQEYTEQSQPQEEVRSVSWELHEARARQLMRQSYERGLRDGERRTYDAIRLAFGPDFLSMIIDNVADVRDEEVVG